MTLGKMIRDNALAENVNSINTIPKYLPSVSTCEVQSLEVSTQNLRSLSHAFTIEEQFKQLTFRSMATIGMPNTITCSIEHKSRFIVNVYSNNSGQGSMVQY